MPCVENVWELTVPAALGTNVRSRTATRKNTLQATSVRAQRADG